MVTATQDQTPVRVQWYAPGHPSHATADATTPDRPTDPPRPTQPPVRSGHPHPPRRQRLSTIASTVALAALAAAWMFTLRPQALRGPAGYVMVRGVSMLPTYQSGDLVIARHQAHYAKGDIIAYHVPKGDIGAGIVVIHRITAGSANTGYTVKGDNNPQPDEWRPKPADIIGKAWLHIPHLARLLAFLHAPVPLASLATGIAAATVLVPAKKRRQPSRKQATPTAAGHDEVEYGPVAVRWREPT